MIVYTHMKKMKVSALISRIYTPLCLFLLTFTIAGYFSLLGVDPHHDGLMFKSAFDVARGSMVFRDTFLQYGALTTLLQAWALLLFGKYLMTVQLLTAFFYGLIAALLYVIYRKIMPPFLSFVTILLWIFMAPYFYAPFLPWASVYALFFQLAGTYLLILYEERGNAWHLVWVGAATTAVFWTRQPGGVCMLGAVYAYLLCPFITKTESIKKFVRAVYLYTCGVAFTTSCFLIWIAARGAFRDFWLQSFLNAYTWGIHQFGTTIYGVIVQLFPGDKSIGFRNIGFLWSVFPGATILVGIACLIALVRKYHVKQTKTILIIAAIGLSAWNQYYPLHDERHIYWGASQMFGLLPFALFAVSGYLLSFVPKLRRKLALGVTCIVLAYFFTPHIVPRVIAAAEKIRTPYVTVSKPDILRGMLMPAGDAQFYTSVSRIIDLYFQKNPKGNVVNTSEDGLYGTFDPRIRNIHPLFISWTQFSYTYPDFFSKTDAYIQTHKPLIIGREAVRDGYCPLIQSPDNFDIVDYVVVLYPC